MARDKSYRWQNFGKQAARPAKPEGRKKSGITNAQAQYLTRLQREAGERRTVAGLTSAQASEQIARLIKDRGYRRPAR